MSHDRTTLPADAAETATEASLGVAAVSAPAYTMCLLAAAEQDVAEFLSREELAGRVDHSDGVTSVVLVDSHFRPLLCDVATAGRLAAATGQQVQLLSGDLVTPPSAPVQGRTETQPVAGLVVNPDGTSSPMTAEQLRRAAIRIPDRSVGTERWLVLGRIPDRCNLPETIASVLPADSGSQARLWLRDGWFLAELLEPELGSDTSMGSASGASGSESPAQLGAAIAGAMSGKEPAIVVRHSDAGALVAQPGGRRRRYLSLEWGMHRMWVHPQWGMAIVDQDEQVTRFAAAWRDAGGEVDQVNLRALSRRRGMRGHVLRPVLECLQVPAALAACAVGDPDAVHEADFQVVQGRRSRGPGQRGFSVTGPGARTAALRGLCATAAVAGCALSYSLIGAGLSGWNWAALGGASVISVGALAAAFGVLPARASTEPASGAAKSHEDTPGTAGIVIDLAGAPAGSHQDPAQL